MQSGRRGRHHVSKKSLCGIFRLHSMLATAGRRGAVLLLLGSSSPGIAFGGRPPLEFDIPAIVKHLEQTVVAIDAVKEAPLGERSHSAGSGVIIDPLGLIVTNSHVVAEAYRLNVKLADGSEYAAKLLSANLFPDIALIKIDVQRPLQTAEFGDSNELMIGETVIAIGNPWGLSNSVSVGVISALSRSVANTVIDDFIQTDAAINPGNSGGPLFNTGGRVVGLNVAAVNPGSGGSVGLGFSIPSNTVRFVVDRLQRYGWLNAGWIGAQVQTVTSGIARAAGMPDLRGGIVVNILRGTPAEKALRLGDIVLKISGEPIFNSGDLTRLAMMLNPGQQARLSIWRDGREVDEDITVVRRPTPRTIFDAPVARTAPVGLPNLGMTFATVDEKLRIMLRLPGGEEGVLVSKIADDSPAIDAGFEVNDVIIRVGDNPVRTVGDLDSTIGRAPEPGGKDVLVLVERGSTRLWLAVPLSGR